MKGAEQGFAIVCIRDACHLEILGMGERVWILFIDLTFCSQLNPMQSTMNVI